MMVRGVREAKKVATTVIRITPMGTEKKQYRAIMNGRTRDSGNSNSRVKSYIR